jgi:hypothetical protein
MQKDPTSIDIHILYIHVKPFLEIFKLVCFRYWTFIGHTSVRNRSWDSGRQKKQLAAQTKPIQRFLVPIGTVVGIPMMQQPMDTLCKEHCRVAVQTTTVLTSSPDAELQPFGTFLRGMKKNYVA